MPASPGILRLLTPLAVGAGLLVGCAEGPGRAAADATQRVTVRLGTLLDAQAGGSARAALTPWSPTSSAAEERTALVFDAPGSLVHALPALDADLVLELAVAASAAGARLEWALAGVRAGTLELPAGAWEQHTLELGAARELELTLLGLPAGERAGLAGLTLRGSVPGAGQPTPDTPSLVLVVIDTLRADRLGCYGNPAGPSPSIDALARRGLLFEEAHAPSSWTLPSTVSILTGLEPPAQPLLERGFVWLPDRITTLAEALARAGFATAAFSANGLVDVAGNNVAQGFERLHVDHGGRLEEFRSEVEDWLRTNAGRRSFLYLHLFEPHRPLEPDADLLAALGGEPMDPARMRRAAAWQRRAERGRPHDRDFLAAYFRDRLVHYDAEIASVDRQLGHLFALLDELDLAERTVVALTSDHGEEFGEHGLSGHAKQLYRESVHVPLILAGPGLPRGRRADHRVALHELPGTLLALCGLPRAGALGGDLLDPQRPADPLGLSTRLGRWFPAAGAPLAGPGAVHGILSGRYKLLRAGHDEELPASGLLRLYDLERDPDELQPLDPAEVEGGAALTAALDAWLAARRAQLADPARERAGERAALEALGYAGD